MKEYALIGYPLTHSFSKSFFDEKFNREHLADCSYTNIELTDLAGIKNFLKVHRSIRGFNITIPHKQTIMQCLDRCADDAKNMGAVNCVRVEPDGSLSGFNTDYSAFAQTLDRLQRRIDNALILGTGGASKAIAYALQSRNIAFRFVSRKSGNTDVVSYDQIDANILSDYTLIVNTTPVGMYPEINEAPAIPYHLINHTHTCYDLIYNPDHTLFLRNAALQGSATKNGLEMLHLQAAISWQIWNTI